MAGLALDAVHRFFKFLLILVLYSFAMRLFVRLLYFLEFTYNFSPQ
jgi:hypothetical protein